MSEARLRELADEWRNRRWDRDVDHIEEICADELEAALAPASDPSAPPNDHLKHVQRFLLEMYQTMVDPVEEFDGNIEKLCALLLQRAREDRQKLEDYSRVAEPAKPPEVEKIVCESCGGVGCGHCSNGYVYFEAAALAAAEPELWPCKCDSLCLKLNPLAPGYFCQADAAQEKMRASKPDFSALIGVAAADAYVAWCRYTKEGPIVTCDSDANGACKVYRQPSAALDRLEGLAAKWNKAADAIDDGTHVTECSKRACDFRARATELLEEVAGFLKKEEKVSYWEYEAGRKACLENMARGDFSNCAPSEYNTELKRNELKKWANEELANIRSGRANGPLDRLEKRVIKLERFGFEVDGRFIEGSGGRNWVRIQEVLDAIRAEKERK